MRAVEHMHQDDSRMIMLGLLGLMLGVPRIHARNCARKSQEVLGTGTAGGPRKSESPSRILGKSQILLNFHDFPDLYQDF